MSPRFTVAIILSLVAAGSPLRAQVQIPLEIFASNQIGISVQLGTASTPFTYLLDTGSVGFLSASGNSSAWTGAFETISPTESFNISYGGGGLQYTGQVAHTTVTFQTVGGGSLQVSNVRMGAITNEPYAGWNANINQIPPVAPENGRFFGTMGAGLNKSEPGNGDFTSILGQIPLAPGLTKGFVIHTGGAASTSATLTVGLSDEMINSFPILLAMNPSIGTFTNDNGTSVNLYPQAQTTANYTITKGIHHYETTANLIMDTGGLDTYLTTGTDINPPNSLLSNDQSQIVDGASFTVNVGATQNPITSITGQPLNWVIDPTGSTAYDNLITVFSGSSVGSLNSGIPLFYNYDVMFDTENGIIGLRAIPEPSSLALAASGVTGILFLLRRIRQRGRAAGH